MSYRALLLKLQYFALLVLFTIGLLKYYAWPLLICVPLAFVMSALVTFLTALLLASWLDR